LGVGGGVGAEGGRGTWRGPRFGRRLGGGGGGGGGGEGWQGGVVEGDGVYRFEGVLELGGLLLGWVGVVLFSS